MKRTNFNEAIFYAATYQEEITAIVDTLLFPNFEIEQGFLLDRQILKEESSEILKFSFTSIPEIEVLKEKYFIEKIPNIGALPKMSSAFYRLKRAAREYCNATNMRNVLIEDIIKNPKQEKETHLDRFSEIHQRTLMLLLFSEQIIDAMAFMLSELELYRHNIVNNNRRNKLKNLKVYMAPESENYKKTRIQLRDFIDIRPEFNPRHLHIKRD